MKRLVLIVMAVVLMAAACSKQIQTEAQLGQSENGAFAPMRSTNSIMVSAVATQTGHVNNYYGVTYSTGTTTNPFKMGKESFYQYKVILTFDTSALPDNAVVDYVNLNLAVNDPDLNKSYYTWQNMKIEFAGSTGFGGSFNLAGGDYSAVAAKAFTSTIGNAAIGGLVLHLDYNQNLRDLNPWISKTGKTQIRLSFNANPSNYLAKWIASDNANPVTLYLGYN